MNEAKQMSVKSEKRSSERLPHRSAISFSIFNRRRCIDAQSLDCSTHGLKFKSTCALRPGTTICIRIKPGQRCPPPGCYLEGVTSVGLAEVKWCRAVEGSGATLYEVGVRYYLPDY